MLDLSNGRSFQGVLLSLSILIDLMLLWRVVVAGVSPSLRGLRETRHPVPLFPHEGAHLTSSPA